MIWEAIIISLITLGVVATGSFFVSALYFVVKHRTHRFGALMGTLMAVAGLVSVFVNPVTNYLLGSAVDGWRLENMRRECLGKPAESLQVWNGAPDSSWTDEGEVRMTWRRTSPSFSMMKANTVAVLSNGVVRAIWLDDD